MRQLKIYYTSDVHGYLFPTDYISDDTKPMGLLQAIQDYDKDGNTLVIDGGDIFQGSPFINYYQNRHDADNGIAAVMNAGGYDYITLGNHDFNYGFDFLTGNLSHLTAQVTAVNVLDKKTGEQLFPAQIKTLENGIKVGLIGAVTDYVNVWEKPEHIATIDIVPVFPAMQAEIDKLRGQVDVLIGIYHGGFERNLETGELLSETGENVGYQLLEMLDFDLLLTGHQHATIEGRYVHGTYTLQPPNMAQKYFEIKIDLADSGDVTITSEMRTPKLLNEPELLAKIQPLQNEIMAYLDAPIVTLENPVAPQSHLDLAQTSNAILALTAHVQKNATGADISIVSMNNNTLELPKNVKVRDVMRNYPFDNTLFVMRLTGVQLKHVIEKTAEYFALENDQMVINENWLVPKKEHYNYDFYYGLDYEIKVSNPVGERLVSLNYQGQAVTDDQTFTVALNNYRAVGGGEYNDYKIAEVVKDTGLTIQDLLIDYLQENPSLEFDEELHVKISK
ncbi:bifunctional metallophosphatase/5'-nucleotidase [Lactococcus insecticola]|uniref:Bifunctional metallophosphatase/5'-nucleotidase n=1 Tax=Pseudolactococcus insecticola TaxID=2709158 RepID=A0A6A0B8E9_9LACT|nr:bifunctional UDP-sugar hydrolase/5'-nucleotidase [Lactococcus insecticola]GFH40097.1 bifunctional metallophosphatase/5'-nucleotidase [Lactococcus insecticola]